jgi:hypothetical protein
MAIFLTLTLVGIVDAGASLDTARSPSSRPSSAILDEIERQVTPQQRVPVDPEATGTRCCA